MKGKTVYSKSRTSDALFYQGSNVIHWRERFGTMQDKFLYIIYIKMANV